MKCLRGRLLCDIIPAGGDTAYGIVIVDRKNISCRGVVLAVGAESRSVKGRILRQPAQEGDIVYWRRYSQDSSYTGDAEGYKKGLTVVWWGDLIAVQDRIDSIKAPLDTVLIDPIYEDRAGSIIIPETHRKSNAGGRGTIVAIGPDSKLDLKLGDHIYYKRHEGVPVEHGRRTFLSLRDEFVLAKLNLK